MNQKSVEVKSSLFPACQNCQVARNTGEDEINKTLEPAPDYTPPSEKSDFVATVACTFDTGVQVLGSQIVYEAEVKVDGKSVATITGPMDWCPVIHAKGQIPA
ncbi:MAG: hypothetical protein NT149_04110 [Candidatus Gottesmanbacteria bacterium]|nr:hypothetical protein [Candidatus Gottesmanbacteria bacterium]